VILTGGGSEEGHEGHIVAWYWMLIVGGNVFDI
jgi:hypothetical protein